jgi:hypothetical protein
VADNPALEQALASVIAELREIEPEYQRLRARVAELQRAEASLSALTGQTSRGGVRVVGRGPVGAARRGTIQSGGAIQAAQRNEAAHTNRRLREQELRAQQDRHQALFVAGVEVGADPATGTLMRTTMVSDGGEVVADDAGSSTDRVIELLRESGRPTRRDVILAEFERRDWVDPTWKAPDAAIRRAIARASARPEVVETRRGWFQYVGPANDDDVIDVVIEEGGDV